MLPRRRFAMLLPLILICGVSGADEPAKPAPPPPASAESKWEKTIAAFEAEDKKSPPPADAVLFYGSSSIEEVVP